MNFYLHRVTARLLRRIVTSVLRNGIRMLACVVIFARRTRRVFQRVDKVDVVRAGPFRAQCVYRLLCRLQRRLFFVRVRSMVNRFLYGSLGFFRPFKGRRTRFIRGFFREAERVFANGSEGNTVEALTITAF